MAREDCVRENRKQLVGLRTTDPKVVLPEGAQGVFDPKAPFHADGRPRHFELLECQSRSQYCYGAR